MTIISKKICLIGRFGVGKTSLIRRFVERQFNDQYLSTVGVKISKKMLELLNEEKLLQLIIWDLAGSDKFKTITPTYLQGASGAVVVADVNRPDTVTAIKDNVQLFLSVNPKGSIVVALNKSDMADQEKLVKLSSECHKDNVIATYFTSAKTGVNVDEMFQELANKVK